MPHIKAVVSSDLASNRERERERKLFVGIRSHRGEIKFGFYYKRRTNFFRSESQFFKTRIDAIMPKFLAFIDAKVFMGAQL